MIKLDLIGAPLGVLIAMRGPLGPSATPKPVIPVPLALEVGSSACGSPPPPTPTATGASRCTIDSVALPAASHSASAPRTPRAGFPTEPDDRRDALR